MSPADKGTVMHRDERGVLVSSLARTLIVVALVAVALFDGAAIVVNFFQIDGIARDAAVEVADLVDEQEISYTDSFGLRRAARQITKPEGARILSITADEEGTVVIEIVREAPTLLVRRIGALREYGQTRATARANTP